jgi:hypothetical protein
MPANQRVVFDEVSGWLEEHLEPTLGTAHREFLWQYVLIFDRWARFHAGHPGIDAQDSLARLAGFTEDALREITAGKPTRLWLNVVRSIPLPVLAHIAMVTDPAHVGELVKIVSAAASLYGDRKPDMPEGDNVLSVEPQWLEDFLQRLPLDVPRCIGAAHTWYFARAWYRMAGKGGVLVPPITTDTQAVRAKLDKMAPGAILLMPSAEFANGEALRPQLDDYDRRSREAGLAGITGFLGSGAGDVPSGPDPMSWWKVGLQVQPGTGVSVSYPLMNRTLNTNSYVPIPDELNPHLARLAPFASLMPSRLGMPFDVFALCCRSVAAILREQTGFRRLRPVSGDGGVLRFRAEHTRADVEASSASFLFSVTHRGLLRAPKAGWVAQMVHMMSQGGAVDPRPDAERFLALFTRERDLDPDLEPGLFLEVDPQTLALDLLAMPSFFDLCLRKITSVDDAPTAESRRGARFEQSAWAFLHEKLHVDLVVPLNTRLGEGATQGEIDIAFRFGDVVVVLECKSWQKRLGYFRGDRSSIEARHEQLRRIVEGQVARNVQLLQRRLGLQDPRDIVSFVCVSGPEFVAKDTTSLWYGDTQRVLTPPEIVQLLADEARWPATVAARRELAGP